MLKRHRSFGGHYPTVLYAVAPVAIIVGGAIYAHFGWRAAKSLRALATEDDLKKDWQSVEPDRRRAIRRRLRRGQAITDPDDAGLALRTVDRAGRVRKILRPIDIGGSIMLVVVVVSLVSLGQPGVAFAAAVALAVVFGALALASAWIWRRCRQSADATRELQAL